MPARATGARLNHRESDAHRGVTSLKSASVQPAEIGPQRCFRELGEYPRFPLKGSLKGYVDIDVDVDSRFWAAVKEFDLSYHNKDL